MGFTPEAPSTMGATLKLEERLLFLSEAPPAWVRTEDVTPNFFPVVSANSRSARRNTGRATQNPGTEQLVWSRRLATGERRLLC